MKRLTHCGEASGDEPGVGDEVSLGPGLEQSEKGSKSRMMDMNLSVCVDEFVLDGMEAAFLKAIEHLCNQ